VVSFVGKVSVNLSIKNVPEPRALESSGKTVMSAKVVDASVRGTVVFGEPEAVKARDRLASIARTKARRTPEKRLVIEEVLAAGHASDWSPNISRCSTLRLPSWAS